MSNGQRLPDDASPIPVVRYEPTSLHGEVLAPRGSVVVYLAARDSRVLESIRAAAGGKEVAGAQLQDVDRLDEDGYAVTLTYGDQVLADQVRVPRDGQPVRLILPFTGGEIEAQELLVRSVDEGAGAVDAVAVRHDPPLSAVEAAALTLLPRDLLSVNLGAALPGGIAMDNEEERRRQAEEQRQAAEEARQERAQQQAEAQAEAAEARAEARREAREAGGISRLEIHMLDSTIRSITSLQTASAMLGIRRDLLNDQMEHG